MKKINAYYKSRRAILMLFCIILFSDLFADSPCGTFVVKINYYTNSGRQDSGYTFFERYSDKTMIYNFIDESYNIFQRVNPNQIDFSKIKGCDSNSYNRILAVNKSVLYNTNISPDFNGYTDLKSLRVTDSIYELDCFDTVNFTYNYIIADSETDYSLDSTIYLYHDIIHYANTKFLDLDSIKLITLDSILWCGDNDQLQFLTTNQVNKLLSTNSYTYFKLADSEAQQFWIDFFCFDPKWAKSRIVSLLDIAKVNNTLLENRGDNIFNDFPPALQRAIQLNKVLYFVRSSP